MTPNHAQEAANRAGREILSPLLEQLEADLGLDAAAVKVVRQALVAALLEGARIGAVEIAAQTAEGVAAANERIAATLLEYGVVDERTRLDFDLDLVVENWDEDD